MIYTENAIAIAIEIAIAIVIASTVLHTVHCIIPYTVQQ